MSVRWLSLDRRVRLAAFGVHRASSAVNWRDNSDFGFFQFSSEVSPDQDIDHVGRESIRTRCVACFRDSILRQWDLVVLSDQALARSL